MSYERKLAPDQPAANDPKYRDAVKRYEMSKLPPIYDQSDYEALREEKDKCIAALEAKVMSQNTIIEALNVVAEQAEAVLEAVKGVVLAETKRADEAASALAEMKWKLNYIDTSAGGESIVAAAESRWTARAEEGNGDE